MSLPPGAGPPTNEEAFLPFEERTQKRRLLNAGALGALVLTAGIDVLAGDTNHTPLLVGAVGYAGFQAVRVARWATSRRQSRQEVKRQHKQAVELARRRQDPVLALSTPRNFGKDRMKNHLRIVFGETDSKKLIADGVDPAHVARTERSAAQASHYPLMPMTPYADIRQQQLEALAAQQAAQARADAATAREDAERSAAAQRAQQEWLDIASAPVPPPSPHSPSPEGFV